MNPLPEVKSIPYYRFNDAENRTAEIVPVSFPASTTSPRDRLVLSHIASAVEGITPLYAIQQFPRICELRRALQVAHEDYTGGVRSRIGVYITLLDMTNAPFDKDGNNFAMLMPYFHGSQDQLDQCNGKPLSLPLSPFKDVLACQYTPPPGRGLYPDGITPGQMSLLKDMKYAKSPNASVIRNKKGALEIVLNEQRFKGVLRPVIQSLRAARGQAKDASLKEYLTATINQLQTGTKQSRWENDQAWLSNQSSIDFMIGSGVETYTDPVSTRGVAQGFVGLVNPKYRELVDRIKSIIPELEQRAPWKHKKKITLENLPRVAFIDVFRWAGGYDWFPVTISAENLPNDEEFKKKFGSIQMIFSNIIEARSRTQRAKLINSMFVDSSVYAAPASHLLHLTYQRIAIHEIGHGTGDHITKDEPRHIFEKEYSTMEEGRAELFAMWEFEDFMKRGWMTKADVETSYYIMLTDMFGAMEMKPFSHTGARQMMFSYLRSKHAIERRKNGNFSINMDTIRPAVTAMLKKIGNIRATGDTKEFASFKAELLESPGFIAEQKEISGAFSTLPLGMGLIFPSFEQQSDGGYSENLVYPERFSHQPRTLGHFSNLISHYSNVIR